MDPAIHAEDGLWYRAESIAAFAHEIRTPLTSLHMLMELGRKRAGEGMLFDPALASLLETAVEELTRMVDDMQDSSRLMRGRVPIQPKPVKLAKVVERAREMLPEGVQLEGKTPTGVDCVIDDERVASVITGLTAGANREGVGDGRVAVAWRVTDEEIEAHFASGNPVGEPRRFDASAGFAFFRARQLAFAMGGSVECERMEQCAQIRMRLPRRFAVTTSST